MKKEKMHELLYQNKTDKEIIEILEDKLDNESNALEKALVAIKALQERAGNYQQALEKISKETVAGRSRTIASQALSPELFPKSLTGSFSWNQKLKG